jgi:hypothetical protein
MLICETSLPVGGLEGTIVRAAKLRTAVGPTRPTFSVFTVPPPLSTLYCAPAIEVPSPDPAFNDLAVRDVCIIQS